MLESQWPILLTAQAAQEVTPGDDGTWGGLQKNFRT
jgi:hypothetical protein